LLLALSEERLITSIACRLAYPHIVFGGQNHIPKGADGSLSRTVHPLGTWSRKPLLYAFLKAEKRHGIGSKNCAVVGQKPGNGGV